MSDNNNMPAHIKAAMKQQGGMDTTAMDTGSGGIPRISLKKSKFTSKVGEEENKLGDTIECVIVGISPERGFAKSYYSSGYSPSSADAPTCQSSDGMRPDGFVDTPAGESCATCEQNVWGSAKSMSGGKAKACKDSKRLHVVLKSDIGEDEPTVYILVVTVLSLKPFGQYGKELTKSGVTSPALVMTELSFDEDASVPKLEFKNMGWLDEAPCAKSMEIAVDRPWESFSPVKAIPHQVDPDDKVPEKTVVKEGDPIDQWD